MIEQLQYTTTSRYNFPQINRDAELHNKLLEASLRSMNDMKEKTFQPFSTELLENIAQRPQTSTSPGLEGKTLSTLLTPLTPIQDSTPVVGIDVSSIKIGETELGILCAVRGAIVWNLNYNYKSLRIGPFSFHVTEENKRELFSNLNNGFLTESSFFHIPLTETISSLCSLVERWIQLSISQSTNDSVILWDGSLMTGYSGSAVNYISHVLKTARIRNNSVLAFSKVTSIRYLGWRITNLVAKKEGPCLFEVEELPLSITKSSNCLGRIYVAKLAVNGSAFRLDIDKALIREDGVKSVRKLLGNEIMYQGYPECLRLAHIYSTFTANDVIGIQSFLTHNYGLRTMPRFSMRKALFGPYGTGFED